MLAEIEMNVWKGTASIESYVGLAEAHPITFELFMYLLSRWVYTSILPRLDTHVHIYNF